MLGWSRGSPRIWRKSTAKLTCASPRKALEAVRGPWEPVAGLPAGAHDDVGDLADALGVRDVGGRVLDGGRETEALAQGPRPPHEGLAEQRNGVQALEVDAVRLGLGVEENVDQVWPMTRLFHWP